MESFMVIKVKYGDTLRRFNAHVADDKISLNMDGLRAKIFQLFNFAPDTEVTLTYIDEDGDEITLVDYDDLLDVTRQGLDPLRIFVRVNAEKNRRQPATSSGNSAPLKSPQVQPTLPNINSSGSDLLKPLPESELEKMLKQSADMASTAREIAEISKALKRIGLSSLKKSLGSQPASETLPQGPASGSTVGVTVTKDSIGLGVDELSSQAFPTVNNGKPSSEQKEPSQAVNAEERTYEAARLPECCAGSLDGATLKSSLPDLNATPCDSLSGPKPNTSLVDCKKDEGKKFGDCHLVGKALDISYSSNSPYILQPFNKQPFKNHPGAEPVASAGTNLAKMSSLGSGIVGCYGSSSGMLSNGIGLQGPYPMNWLHAIPVPPLYSASEIPVNHRDGSATIFHRGIRCDGCGVHPITGARFKSKVKEDYDLCSICFYRMGNDAEYIRMDRPATYNQPLAFRSLYELPDRIWGPTAPQAWEDLWVKSGGLKLDSRFVEDVNVLDGTIMAPLTPFTKVWRMRNNGNNVWPQGTQLVWIGGERLTDAFSVELQVPSDGLAVGQELDVLVDFTAPELPGRYISYWRLASPSGQKFGQRVWVLIQVDAPVKLPKKEYLNLNFPPASSDVAGPETINANPEHIMEDIISEPNISNLSVEFVDDKSSISPAAPGSSSSYPIDLTEAAADVTSGTPPSVTEVPASSQVVSGNCEVESTLLKELEEMGFKQVDLNKEILKKNEYDLDQAVDDLCVVADWDPILEELVEMGFPDKVMNKKLLEKNNGSIHRVVMDLISGEDD